MKQYIKGGAKILFNYAMAMIVFLIFLYPFINLTKDKLYIWLPFYSLVFFLFVFFLIYTEMKELAIKEKKPQNQLNPFPFKGAIYGFFSIIPLGLAAMAISIIHFDNIALERIRHLLVNTLLGPLYFVYGPLEETVFGYIAAIMLIPLVAMLGYLAGYFGITIMDKIIKKKAVQEKGFTKSPWNPTAGVKKGSGKKKKKKIVSGGQ